MALQNVIYLLLQKYLNRQLNFVHFVSKCPDSCFFSLDFEVFERYSFSKEFGRQKTVAGGGCWCPGITICGICKRGFIDENHCG